MVPNATRHKISKFLTGILVARGVDDVTNYLSVVM